MVLILWGGCLVLTESVITMFNFFSELVNPQDLSLGFIRINELNAMCSVEINNGQEYLLCFHCKQYYMYSTCSICTVYMYMYVLV